LIAEHSRKFGGNDRAEIGGNFPVALTANAAA
jgi:hypothetical protein